MYATTQLANRVRQVLLDGKWIANTNYKEQLEGLSWNQATHQMNHLNTIALLTFHINYYLKGLLNVFQGGTLDIKDKYSFDMPELQSEAEWQNLANDFIANAEGFAIAIEQLNEAKLMQPFVDEKYGTYLRNIEGFIEHSYYHLGQVVLMRKLIGNTTNSV